MRLTTPGFLLVSLITLLALVLYFVLTMRVVAMRGKSRVAAPNMTGDADFERAVRIQSNTLEQLVPFVVAMWLCAAYLQPLFAALVGVVWLVCRVIYAFSYTADPARRGIPFAISMIATVVLIAGAFVGIVLVYLRLP